MAHANSILPPALAFTGRVHLIAIGVNDFSGTELDTIQLPTAEQDAINFGTLLMQDSLVKEVINYSFNGENSKSDILESFNRIAVRAMRDDVFILFVASACTNLGALVLADGSTLSAEELFFASQNIICNNQLFFVDACNGDQFVDQFVDKLSKNPKESLLGKTNRMIIGVNGSSIQSFEDAHLAISSIPSANLHLIDVFGNSDGALNLFMHEFYTCTDTLDRTANFQWIYFSENEYYANTLPNRYLRGSIPLDDNANKGKTKTISKGETLCFIIACDKFEAFSDLRNPCNDAKEIKRLLDAKYRTKVIYLSNPSLDQFRREMSDITKKYKFEPGSQFLLFGSSHGTKDECNVGQMVFKDSYFDTEDSLLQNTYSLISIKRAVSQLNCINSLIMLDICHAGTMFDDGTCNEINTIPIPLESEIYKSSQLAFANFLNQKTNLFFSSSRDQVAADGVGDHSPFAKVVLEFLETNNLEVIDSYYLEKEITEKVMQYGSYSLPMFCSYNSEKHDGRFLFIEK